MTKLTISELKKMFINGGLAIANEFEYINKLNIFPVPDGDTGSNMRITTEGASQAINSSTFSDLLSFGKVYSRALLMNARGNSGVIFSQIMKGFVSTFKPESNELSLNEVINSFTAAKDQAYKALSSPVEGTILTVIRLTADGLVKKKESIKTIEELFELAVDLSKKALEETPNMLPQLKNANVVDSGGYGLCCYIQGMCDAVSNNNVGTIATKSKKVTKDKGTNKNAFIDSVSDNNEGFGYCCEFIMTIGSKVGFYQRDKKKFNLKEFKKELLKIGDSLAVVVDEEIVKVHVHSLWPYMVLKIGSRYGEFNKVKIENMTLQFMENNPGTTLEELTRMKKQGSKSTKKPLDPTPKIIVTVPTDEMEKLFHNSLHADYIINYSINGNPSIREFLDAFRAVNSSKIILIIDDSNAMLAANQAIKLMDKKSKIHVFVSNDISVSYLACKCYVPSLDFNSNLKKIRKATHANFGKIGIASKKAKYGHVKILPKDYIGFFNKKIIISNKSQMNVFKKICDVVIKRSKIKKRKSINIFVGVDVSIDDILKIQKYLTEKYSLKAKIIQSGQKIYNYHIIV
ncbi:MAG: DAK2 domain-containing protein [Mycoplasma sp.]|nr:DAK2 domain-containing protein [Mycoplasma sp.]